MAKQRTKSLSGIVGQAASLKSQLKQQMKEAYSSGDRGRYDQLRDRYLKVANAKTKYENNITKQKAYVNVKAKGVAAFKQGNGMGAIDNANKATNRQWARSTYMGTSNG